MHKIFWTMWAKLMKAPNDPILGRFYEENSMKTNESFTLLSLASAILVFSIINTVLLTRNVALSERAYKRVRSEFEADLIKEVNDALEEKYHRQIWVTSNHGLTQRQLIVYGPEWPTNIGELNGRQ